MLAATIDEMAGAFARRLEDRERVRSCVSLPAARRRVAERTGISAGTLENLRRGRSKGVRGWVFDRLRAAVISELEAEVRLAEHELSILRVSRRRVDQEQIAEVVEGLAALRCVLRGERSP